MVPRATGGVQGRTPCEVGIIDEPEGLGYICGVRAEGPSEAS